jgi:hypothetical protein
MFRWTSALLIVGLLAGCQTASSSRAVRAHDTITSADLLRMKDYAGLVTNDQRTITDPKLLAKLESFFPEMDTQKTSTLLGIWVPWIVVRFNRADATNTLVSSDYRIYRMGGGERGDFVLPPGFPAFVDQIFQTPPASAPSK